MNTEDIYIGTHNSMSYLKPAHWYMRPFNFIAKCQSKDIYWQLADNDCVDLRVCVKDDTNDVIWTFRHGLIEYKQVDLMKLLQCINIQYKNKIVRFILEHTRRKKEDIDSMYFIQLCNHIEQKYTNIKFIGGNRKSDWKKLYTFKNDISDTLNNQFVSSMANDARWYERICPYLYARRKNHDNFRKLKPIINLYDYIHIV